jgi:hypothetical protein
MRQGDDRANEFAATTTRSPPSWTVRIRARRWCRARGSIEIHPTRHGPARGVGNVAARQPNGLYPLFFGGGTSSSEGALEPADRSPDARSREPSPAHAAGGTAHLDRDLSDLARGVGNVAAGQPNGLYPHFFGEAHPPPKARWSRRIGHPMRDPVNRPPRTWLAEPRIRPPAVRDPAAPRARWPPGSRSARCRCGARPR